jgi:hypothetical protein
LNFGHGAERRSSLAGRDWYGNYLCHDTGLPQPNRGVDQNIAGVRHISIHETGDDGSSLLADHLHAAVAESLVLTSVESRLMAVRQRKRALSLGQGSGVA